MTTVHTGNELKRELLKVKSLYEGDFKELLTKLSMDAFRWAMERTAIDTGFARSNWLVAVDSSPAYTSRKNPGGTFSDSSFPSVDIKAGSVVTIYNNTEYIIHLENGTPTNRAQPMIEPTYQMLVVAAKRLTALLSNKRYNV